MRHGNVGPPGASKMTSSFLHWCFLWFAYSLIRIHYSQWGDVFADFCCCMAASETICIPKDTWCQGVPFGCKRWRHPCLVTSQYPVLWFKTDILTPCSLNTVEYLRVKWTSNYTYCTGLSVQVSHGSVRTPGASQMTSSFLHWCLWKNTVIRFISQRRNICQIFCTRWKERVPIFYQV